MCQYIHQGTKIDFRLKKKRDGKRQTAKGARLEPGSPGWEGTPLASSPRERLLLQAERALAVS